MSKPFNNKIKELKQEINELEVKYYDIQERLYHLEKKYNIYRILNKYNEQYDEQLTLIKWKDFINNNYDFIDSIYRSDDYKYNELFLDMIYL